MGDNVLILWGSHSYKFIVASPGISNDLCISALAPCTQERVNLSSSGNSRGLSFSDPAGDATNIINDMWSASLSQSTCQQMTDRGGNSEQASSEASAFPIHEVS